MSQHVIQERDTDVASGAAAGSPASAPRPALLSVPTLVFLVLLLGAVVLHLYHLAHAYVAPWDESFHAVVAEHLARHPLQPTLYETAALHRNVPGSSIWGKYPHIWLHIPPLGLWASALSMRLLGVSTFALRLPSVLWIALGMVATYALGRNLYGAHGAYGAVVGLIGAALVGYSPYLMLLSQGYVFGDITDTPLLALVPLAILALARGWRSGRLRWLVAAGALQGLAYLTKGALGLAPTGVALLLCAADYRLPLEAGWRNLRLRGLLPFLGAAALVALPYNLYIAHAFPAISAMENRSWKAAFFSNYEHWGRPADFHLTGYLFALYGGALALLLVGSTVALAIVGVRRRSRADLLLVVWVLALYLPLSLAVTKSVPMTIAAVPAFGLLTARALLLAFRSRRLLWRALGLGALAGAALAAVLIVALPIAGVDFNPRSTMPEPFDPLPLGLHILPYALDGGLTLLFALLFTVLLSGTGSGLRARLAALRAPVAVEAAPWRHAVVLTVVVAALAVLAVYWLRYDWMVVARVPDDPGSAQAFGSLLRRTTPPNATILLAVNQRPHTNERITVMFWADRDVYDLPSVRPDTICPLVATARRSGSPVFVATTARYDGTMLGSTAGWTLYAPGCSVWP